MGARKGTGTGEEGAKVTGEMGVKPRKSERRRPRWEKERVSERRPGRDREHGRPVSTGVCMMGEAPPRLEFPLGLVLAI